MNECKICLSAYYECQKPRGTSKNLPGAESPTTNNGTYDLSPTYVYILIYYEKNKYWEGIRRNHYLWPECRHIIPSTQGVCRNICTDRCQAERESSKKSCCTVIPLINQLERVPENLPVKLISSASNGNPNEATKSDSDWDNDDLDVLTRHDFNKFASYRYSFYLRPLVLGVTSKI